MTLEKSTPSSIFARNNTIPDTPSDKFKVIQSPGLANPDTLPAYTKTAHDSVSLSGRRLLNRTISNNTYISRSSVSGFSNRTWGPSSLLPYTSDKKCHTPKVSSRSSNNQVKLQSISKTPKPESLGHHSSKHSLLKNNPAPAQLASNVNKNRISHDKDTTCPREHTPHLSPPMPKSSGQSSRSSAARRSEKDSKTHDSCRSLNPESSHPSVDIPAKKIRPQSADGQRKETTTCSFFYFIRKKKKGSRSTSPESRDKKSNRQHTRNRSIVSFSSAQSAPESDRAFCPSEKDCLISEHSLTSSRIRQHSASITHSQSITSPSISTPLLANTSSDFNENKNQKYTSRSRSKHRRDRRHRSHKLKFKPQPEDRLRLEDLPPHPSIYNTRSRSEPAIPHVTFSFSNNVNDSNNSNPNKNNESNINNNKPDKSTRLRKTSKAESSTNTKSAVVSLCSGVNRKNSTTDSALRDKSQHSTSRTDIEDDSHYQFTASSSDHQPRKAFRSQSLPSFRGEQFLLDADTKVISDAEDFEYKPTDMKGPLHLSLCGCGFLGMYHLGVVSCLTLRGLSFLEKVEKVCGASAGALMAAVLVTARDKIEESAEHVQTLAKEIRRKPLGALTPGYNFTRSLRYMLEDILPEDAHETAQGKLYVSLTNADTKKNELMSDFRSRDELIEALIASCYIPVYAGIKLPVVRGKKYIDGGLSDNLPRFGTGRTITVSPFDGKSDIGPKVGQEAEKKAHFISVHNQDIQTLQTYFENGRNDASRFLIREGLYEIIPPQAKPVLYESSV